MRRRCAHGRERYVPEDGWMEWKGPEAINASRQRTSTRSGRSTVRSPYRVAEAHRSEGRFGCISTV